MIWLKIHRIDESLHEGEAVNDNSDSKISLSILSNCSFLVVISSTRSNCIMYGAG
jgi:hypothetical protein